MRKQWLAWTSASFIFTGVIAISQAPVAVKPQESGLPGLEDTASRISRIEAGLLPAAFIQGQSLPRMLLTDRMKHYDVPGVSIAVFDHGQILWTRGYGLADILTSKPVT